MTPEEAKEYGIIDEVIRKLPPHLLVSGLRSSWMEEKLVRPSRKIRIMGSLCKRLPCRMCVYEHFMAGVGTHDLFMVGVGTHDPLTFDRHVHMNRLVALLVWHIHVSTFL